MQIITEITQIITESMTKNGYVKTIMLIGSTGAIAIYIIRFIIGIIMDCVSEIKNKKEAKKKNADSKHNN